MRICDYCGIREDESNGICTSRLSQTERHHWVHETVLPEGQGKRTILCPRHDLIPLEFLDELASIFEEGYIKYGDSWRKGGQDFLIDCLNHASNHLHKYMNGDTSENQLAKVAWNVLVVRYFDKKGGGLGGQTRISQTMDAPLAQTVSDKTPGRQEKER